MMNKLLFLFLSLFIIQGCSSSSSTTDIKANITKTDVISIPKPVFSSSEKSTVLLTTNYQNDKRKLIVLTENTEDKLVLTGVTTSYINLFTLTYTKDELKLETKLPKSMLPPVNQVLLDIMLCKSENLENELNENFIVNDSTDKRIITDKNGKIIYNISFKNIKHKKLPVEIDNKEYAYKIYLKYL